MPIGSRRVFRGTDTIAADEPPSRGPPPPPSSQRAPRGPRNRGGDRSAQQTGANTMPLATKRRTLGSPAKCEASPSHRERSPPPPRARTPPRRTPPPTSRSQRPPSHEPRNHGPPRAPLGKFNHIDDLPHEPSHQPRDHGPSPSYPPGYPVAHRQDSPLQTRSAGRLPPYDSSSERKQRPSNEPRDHRPRKLNSFSTRPPMPASRLRARSPIPDGTQADRRALNQSAVNFVVNSWPKINPYSVAAAHQAVEARRRNDSLRERSSPPPRQRRPSSRSSSPAPRRERHRSPTPPTRRERTPPRTHARVPARRATPSPPPTRRRHSPASSARRSPPPPVRRDSPPPVARRSPSPPPPRRRDDDSSPRQRRASPVCKRQAAERAVDRVFASARSTTTRAPRSRSPHTTDTVKRRGEPEAPRRRERRSPSLEKRADQPRESRSEKAPRKVAVTKERERLVARPQLRRVVLSSRARTPPPATVEESTRRSPTPDEADLESASSPTSSPVYELDDLDAELGLDDADAMMPLHTIVDTPEPVEDDDEEEEGQIDTDVELDYEEEGHVDHVVNDAEESDVDEQQLREKLLEQRRVDSSERRRRSPSPADKRRRDGGRSEVGRARSPVEDRRDRAPTSRSRASPPRNHERDRRPSSRERRSGDQPPRREAPPSHSMPPPPARDSGMQYSFPAERDVRKPRSPPPSRRDAPRQASPPPRRRESPTSRRSPPTRLPKRASPPARRSSPPPRRASPSPHRAPPPPPSRRRSPAYRRQPTGRIQPALLERKYAESREVLTEAVREGVRDSLSAGGRRVAKGALDVLMKPTRVERPADASPPVAAAPRRSPVEGARVEREREEPQIAQRAPSKLRRDERMPTPPMPARKRPTQSSSIAVNNSSEETGVDDAPPPPTTKGDDDGELDDYEEVVEKAVPEETKGAPKRERICFDLEKDDDDAGAGRLDDVVNDSNNPKRRRRRSPPSSTGTRRVVRSEHRPTVVRVHADDGATSRSLSYGHPSESADVRPGGRPPTNRRVVINKEHSRRH